jgi:aminoglycoside/choline kinase family phosphotransferase
VRELAKFHAYWWDTDELKALDEIPYLSDPIWRQHTQLFEFAWPLWKEQFGGTVSAYCLETAERWGHAIPKMLDMLSEPPCTIIHMDYRLPNLFFRGPEGGVEFAVADWQPYSRAKGPYDIAYFLAESIPTEQRRRLQDEVLRLYHATLLENGVQDYSFDRCFEDFRLGVAYTILYPMGTVTVDLGNEHGRAYQRAINQRHMAAVDDLRVGDVIPD